MKQIFSIEHWYTAALMIGGLAAAILSPAWILRQEGPGAGRPLAVAFIVGAAILALDLIRMAWRARRDREARNRLFI